MQLQIYRNTKLAIMPVLPVSYVFENSDCTDPSQIPDRPPFPDFQGELCIRHTCNWIDIFMTTFPPLEVILASHDIPSSVLDPLIISSSISVIWVIFWFFAYLFIESIDMSYFAYACKTEGKNGISCLISALCVNCLNSIPEYSRIIDYSIIWMCIWCGLLQKLYKIKKSELLNSKVYSKV